MEVVLLLIASLTVAACWIVWSARDRTATVDDPRESGRAWADAERTRSAGYVCSHLPIDNPRVSGSRGGF